MGSYCMNPPFFWMKSRFMLILLTLACHIALIFLCLHKAICLFYHSAINFTKSI
jgi:hypothetical protein